MDKSRTAVSFHLPVRHAGISFILLLDTTPSRLEQTRCNCHNGSN